MSLTVDLVDGTDCSAAQGARFAQNNLLARHAHNAVASWKGIVAASRAAIDVRFLDLSFACQCGNASEGGGEQQLHAESVDGAIFLISGSTYLDNSLAIGLSDFYWGETIPQ